MLDILRQFLALLKTLNDLENGVNMYELWDDTKDLSRGVDDHPPPPKDKLFSRKCESTHEKSKNNYICFWKVLKR
jgi:hypothetical protein